MTTASRPTLQDYLKLCKLKVVALIMLTAIVGMFMSVPGLPPMDLVIFGSIGIALASSSAAVFNHVVDQRIDNIMGRTKDRPMPKGKVNTKQAIIFGVIVGIIGIGTLVVFVNLLTAILTFFALIGYAVIYTMYLKRATPQNIVIGGAAGAAPPILGWTAITNSVDVGALLLFLIVFIWTPPHFWALAIHRHEEYAKVDVPMLPVTHGIPFTRLQILLYTIILVIVTIVPYLIGMCGLVYLTGAIVLGGGFLYYAIQMLRRPENSKLPMKTFGYSINYLMALFVILLVDHYFPLHLNQLV
ncbi:heme o synthase [Leucothrix pacifica]|uniref:Protoheme IX farnesyltransferase n=1 Tax=Leucothrix pacifica TaxID=1247513 RepID=A0A317CLU8_9GAMM|nr:heme o synthase [Leucothrix pacifica]PWQ99187.1 protoheme IX farnesyltransferase [Leucothrix pacifica]